MHSLHLLPSPTNSLLFFYIFINTLPIIIEQT